MSLPAVTLYLVAPQPSDSLKTDKHSGLKLKASSVETHPTHPLHISPNAHGRSPLCLRRPRQVGVFFAYFGMFIVITIVDTQGCCHRSLLLSGSRTQHGAEYQPCAWELSCTKS